MILVVQSLYEKKLTTYPRTDARVLSSAVADEILTNLKGLSKGSYLTDVVNNIINKGSYKGLAKTRYTDDSKITDHYAIIPTGYTSASLNEMEEEFIFVVMVALAQLLVIFVVTSIRYVITRMKNIVLNA